MKNQSDFYVTSITCLLIYRINITHKVLLDNIS